MINSIVCVIEEHMNQQVPTETLDSQHFIEQQFMSPQLPSLTQANLTQANLSYGFSSQAFSEGRLMLMHNESATGPTVNSQKSSCSGSLYNQNFLTPPIRGKISPNLYSTSSQRSNVSNHSRASNHPKAS